MATAIGFALVLFLVFVLAAVSAAASLAAIASAVTDQNLHYGIPKSDQPKEEEDA